MARSHEGGGGPVERRHRHTGWITEITGVDQGEAADGTGLGHHDHRVPELEAELGVGYLEAKDGNGNGRRGDGEHMPDPRPDPDNLPRPNGRPAGSGSGGTPEASGPHFMPPELAQPLGDLSLRSMNDQAF